MHTHTHTRSHTHALTHKQLEQERHEFLEELTSVREELVVETRELKEKTTQNASLTAAYDKDTRTLRDQLSEVGIIPVAVEVLIT